jgi:hypothetical protein
VSEDDVEIIKRTSESLLLSSSRYRTDRTYLLNRPMQGTAHSQRTVPIIGSRRGVGGQRPLGVPLCVNAAEVSGRVGSAD